jgi:septal ring factor EnvC (AmiA/AmiB activator)
MYPTVLIWSLLAALLAASASSAAAQSKDDALSGKEVEELRDAAYVPTDRIEAYEKILDTRERTIEDLLAKPRHVTFGIDMHDAIDQFGAIADEMNDNLDELNAQHHDLRKVLPKLVKATERWTTILRSPGEDDAYKVVRRIALDAVKDTHDMAVEMEASEEAYFKAHPEAAKEEKARKNDPHAPQ